jgi:diadenosine tetraphosphate (Ap4A) HIT family hydrolase
MSSSAPDDCVFCLIEAGEAPASVVYEDDDVFAILSLHPFNPGHALVIPRAHAPHLTDVDDEMAARLLTVGKRIARSLDRSSIPCEGVNYLVANGDAAEQEIDHLHLHVIPRVADDGISIATPRPDAASREELDAVAEDVRTALDE